MTAPIPNVDLLRRTLAYIEEHPGEHDQTRWRCGTRACFAGTAAMLDGGIWARGVPCMSARSDDPPDHVVAHVIHVAHRARRILGLTEDQARDLFCGANDLDDLRDVVAELTGGAS